MESLFGRLKFQYAMLFDVSGRRGGLLLIIIADLLWGTVFVASQVGLQYTNPYNLVFLRFFISSIIIGFVALIFNKRLRLVKELKKKWTWFFGAIYMFGFLFQYLGQDLTTVSEATLLANLAPIIVPVFAFFLLKEKISTLQKLAMVLGFTGLLLISSPNLDVGSTHLIGDLLLFGTSVSYALFTALGKKNNMVTTASSFAVIISTTVFLAPIALMLGGAAYFDPNIGVLAWAAILYLGIPCTLLAITIYLKGLAIIPASEAAVFFLLQVLVGLALSALLFGDFLDVSQSLGALMIFAALAFGVKFKKR